MCVLVMVCASLFGMGRVMLSTKAIEASFQSEEIAADIKAEQLTGDLLEVDKSSLATPSRIEQIASETMSMSEAGDITYLCLPDGEIAAVAGTSPPDESTDTEGGLAALFSSVMEMTAGEAQVLLVGDLGLASSR